MLIRLARRFRDLRDHLRSKAEVRPETIRDFEEWRARRRVSEEPLVSVCVATYNRPRLLVERCVTSILRQTYPRIEAIVVGDGSPPDTEAALRKISDPRLKFFNLPQNGPYPEDRTKRWMVAGTFALNKGMELAQGEFITHLDDDDEHLPDRVEKLVAFCRRTSAEFVWHPFWFEPEPDVWQVKESPTFTFGQVTTSSVFYGSWFRKIGWDVRAWEKNEPGDWNRFRKIRYLRPHALRFSEPLLRHYRERNQPTAQPAPTK